MTDYAKEIALDWARLGPAGSVSKLGLQFRKSGREVSVCCPWHAEKTPSCSITIGQQGTIRVHCFGCDQTWDMHSFVGQLAGIDPKHSFPALLLHEAELLGRWDIVDALEGKTECRPKPERKPPPAPKPEKQFPDREQLSDFLGACKPCTSDHEVDAWLESRGLKASDVEVRGLAMALPKDVDVPSWATYKGEPWNQTGHRLILTLHDEHGQVVSVRAGRVVDGESPKRLPPAGCRGTGVIMADALTVEVLRLGSWPEWAGTEPRFVVVEGEPDFLTIATRLPMSEANRVGAIGIFSGGWTKEIAARIPTDSRVVVWTDRDAAGEKYAQLVADTLGMRCHVSRGTP